MTTNSLLTLGGITREAVRLWKNSNAFLNSIDRQYDQEYRNRGAKIGEQLRIRLPNDFVARTGPTLSLNTVNEKQTTLVMGTQKGVDVPFSSVDRTLSLQDYSKRILAPMVNVLAGAVAADVMSGAMPSMMTSNTTSPTADDYLNAGALLTDMSAPTGDRKAILSPRTNARTVGSLTGLFNPTGRISKQFDSGMMAGPALGIAEWMEDQTVVTATPGTATGLTVSGANQTGNSLTLEATGAGTLNAGDIITLAGVHNVNRITKQAGADLAQFVVTATVNLAANTPTAVSIYPAITPSNAGAAVQYQTVDNSPANAAAITLLTAGFAAGYRRNMVLRPEAVTLVMADLWMPDKGVVESARESFDGVSLRMITAYDPTSDQTYTRLDVLYGYLWVRNEWACLVPDII